MVQWILFFFVLQTACEKATHHSRLQNLDEVTFTTTGTQSQVIHPDEDYTIESTNYSVKIGTGTFDEIVVSTFTPLEVGEGLILSTVDVQGQQIEAIKPIEVCLKTNDSTNKKVEISSPDDSHIVEGQLNSEKLCISTQVLNGTIKIHQSGQASPEDLGNLNWASPIDNINVFLNHNIEETITAIHENNAEISYSLDTQNMTCSSDNFDPILNIDQTTGVLSGTPIISKGSCTIIVIASRTDKAVSIEQHIQVNISAPPADSDKWVQNTPQTIYQTIELSGLSIAPEPLIQGVTYQLDLPNSNCDDGFIDSIAIDRISGTISGTPQNKKASCYISVTATNGTFSSSQKVDFSLTDVRETLAWKSIPTDLTIHEDESITGINFVAAENTNTLTPRYTIHTSQTTCLQTSFSPTLSIDPATGSISGTPLQSAIGTCTLSIQAHLDEFQIEHTAQLIILASNDAPTWDSTIADFTISEDTPLAGKTAQASDVDTNDTPAYSFDLTNMTCDDGAWDSLSIHSTNGSISGTPTNSDVGSCTIRVLATSGADTISDDFTVTVSNTNDTPTWTSGNFDFSVETTNAISSTQITATDIDVGDSISYSLDSALTTCDDGSWSAQPAIHNTSGAISGTPSLTDVGVCQLRVIATDTQASSAYITVNVTVTPPPAPNAPINMNTTGTTTSLTNTWSDGGGSTVGYLVVQDTSPINWTPTDTTDYSVGTNNIICKGAATSCLSSSLSSGTIYHTAVFAYNSSFYYSGSDSDTAYTGSAATDLIWDFENSSDMDGWSQGGSNGFGDGFTRSSSNSINGSYSARSDTIGTSGDACFSRPINLREKGNKTIEFWWKIDADDAGDDLGFFTNWSGQVTSISGTQGPAQYSHTLSGSGVTTIQWCLDRYNSSGSSHAWVDDIHIVNYYDAIAASSAPLSPVMSNFTSDESSIQLSWADGGGDTVGYIVVADTSDPSWQPTNGVDYFFAPSEAIYVGSSLSYDYTALSLSTKYFFDIYAYDQNFNYSIPLSRNIWTDIEVSSLSTITHNNLTWRKKVNSSTSTSYPSVSGNEVTMHPDAISDGSAMFTERSFSIPFTVNFEYKISDDGGEGFSFNWGWDYEDYVSNNPHENFKGGLTSYDGYSVVFDNSGTDYLNFSNGRAVEHLDSSVFSSIATDIIETNTWSSVKIEVTEDNVKVYLHGSSTPQLDYTHYDKFYITDHFGTNHEAIRIGFASGNKSYNAQSVSIRDITITHP